MRHINPGRGYGLHRIPRGEVQSGEPCAPWCGTLWPRTRRLEVQFRVVDGQSDVSQSAAGACFVQWAHQRFGEVQCAAPRFVSGPCVVESAVRRQAVPRSCQGCRAVGPALGNESAKVGVCGVDARECCHHNTSVAVVERHVIH